MALTFTIERTLSFHIAQLRHLYSHLMAGRVENPQGLAEGLLAPVIRELERMRPSQMEIDTARDLALRMTVGSCTCGVKPPDPEPHAERCFYRRARTIFELLGGEKA